jgi:hypothetical protein
MVMPRSLGFSRFVLAAVVVAAAAAAMALTLHAADPANFKPDGSFKGSSLAGWRIVGDVEWTAQSGELVGRAKAGTSGGWLVMDKSFQDVKLYLNYRCTGECKSGVLLRAHKTADGMAGVFVSLAEGDTGSYAVTLDSSWKETARDALTAPATAGRGAAATGGRGPLGASAPAAAPAPPPRGTQQGGQRGATLKPGEWNETYITIGQEGPAGNTPAGTPGPVRILSTFGATVPVDEKNATTYGAVALYVGGTGEVRIKDFAWKDLMSMEQPKEVVSNRFRIQRLTTFYYGWGATTADVDHDGNVDVVSGPFYYRGPQFTDQRRYRAGVIYNPESSFAPDMVNLAADFTGDGWPDVLSSIGNRNMDLYVNPAGESRRWDKFSVLPTISSEIVLLRDLDKDGKPEVIFGQGAARGYAWARPDPANPTAVWTPHVISSPGQAVNGHGIGVGDVNGDGRLDVVVPTGWYEQPEGGIAVSGWPFHEAELGEPTVFGSGGGEMGVFDVNGDGLTDVVAGSAHNWGLNWFPQKKGTDGSRTFERHSIAKNFATQNAGGVVFSESHAERFIDLDGDKIPEMITGKRFWSEGGNNTLSHMDPSGAPVLYIYKIARDAKAPGGARFVPELVHNKSGVGSTFDVVDLNKDGKLDIVTATTFGTYVFFAK